MHTLPFSIPIATALLALSACSKSPPAVASLDGSGAERIIAREAERQDRTDTPGLELQVEGQRLFFDIGQSSSYSDSGMGEVSISLKASRIDGRAAAAAEVTLANLRPVEGTQQIGNGGPRPVHVRLTGVPERDGTLHSLQGSVKVDALRTDKSGRINGIDARFSGRFSAYSEDSEAFIDPTHADAVEISGRLNIERN